VSDWQQSTFHFINEGGLRPTDLDIETIGGSTEGAPVKSSRLLAAQLSDMDIVEAKRVPIGSTPVIALEGDSTEEKPYQRAVVTAHFSVVLLNVLMAASAIFGDMPHGLGGMEIIGTKVLPVLVTLYASVAIGDLGTGVFHWSVDNYGGLGTPVVGTICHAFQGHHVSPWTITFRSLANNLYKVAYGCATPLLLLTVLPGIGPYVRLFSALFINWWLVSQELHKLSHLKKTPPLVKKAMDAGLILSKKDHGMHHTPPFSTHYCILTGQNNRWMDESHFFRRLERIVYKRTGAVPNTWNEEGGDKVRAIAMGMGEED
jgi:ubiquitin-conjugating enzyme E2 variant